MPTLTENKNKMRELSVKALEVVRAEDRTPAEKREEVEKIEADIKALSDEIYVAEKGQQFESAGEAPQEEIPTASTGRKSLGEQFFTDPTLKDFSGRPGPGFRVSVETKATVTEAASPVIQPDVQPGVLPILFQRLTVADLMPSGQTGSNTVRYLKETTATNAASSVAEGGAKPASTLIYSQVDEPVRKLATSIKVSDEMLADVPFIRGQIDGRLVLFVRIQEEAELLKGNGLAPDLTGLLNRSGLTSAQPKGGDSAIDAIYKDITAIRVASFLDPDGIVLHPTDWEGIRLLKDQNLQYYGGGPFTGAYGNGGQVTDNGNLGATESLWGCRVVVTTAMTQGTALVGAFATGAQVFRNGGLTVEATNANEDDFLKNLVAIRAEERLALAVYRPSAFSTVTGL